MKTCKRGHEYSTSCCVVCRRAAQKRWKDEHRDHIRALEKIRRNTDECRLTARSWKRENPEFNVYYLMKIRCLDQDSAAYPNYGGRGITVCDRWLGVDGYKNFMQDMGKRPTPKHTLDRTNNNLGYGPDNCRWVTMSEQQRNRRGNVVIAYNGKAQCISAWAEEFSLPYFCVCQRLKKLGWPPERAFTTPVRRKLWVK